MSDLKKLVQEEPKRALLKILKDAGPEGVSSVELTKLGYYDDYGMFEYGKELLTDGEPIRFDCCEGYWCAMGCSNGPIGLSYVQNPDQLGDVKEMIRREMADLEKCLSGLETACGKMRGLQDEDGNR